MTKMTKITAWALVAGIFLVGCSYQRKIYLKRTDLPEYIYRIPLENDYIGANVVVFNFREPPYAKGMGKVAADALYHDLLANKVFASVTHEEEVLDLRMENVLNIARDNDYDMIIVGDLLYYFEGSLHLPSRIDQRLRVIDAKKNRTLWYAKAVDIGPNAPCSDFYVVQGTGAVAPTTRTLFARNASKFSKMLISQPPQAFLASMKAGQGSGSLTGSNDGLETGPEPRTQTRYLQLQLEDDQESPHRLKAETVNRLTAEKTAIDPD